MKIIELKPEEYGLEVTKAAEISKMFKPMLDIMEEYEKEYNEIALMEQSEEKSIAAKELRLKYVKVRTGTDKIHTELKSFYLKGGRFVDGWRNTQRMASEQVETELKAIENYYENLKAEEFKKLQEDREIELIEYMDEGVDLPKNLGEMDETIWKGFLSGMKSNYLERVEQERLAQEEQDKNRALDNLLRERELEIAPYGDFIDEYPSDLRNMSQENYIDFLEGLKLLKTAKDNADEQARLENIRLQEEKEKQEKESAESLRIEREAKEKAEAELKEKAEAEQRKKDEEAAALEAELNKGDKAKINDLIADLEGLKTKYQFKSVKNKKMLADVQILINKTIDFINK